MLYIALESGDTITVQDVYEKEDVSKRYLEQIFAELKKNGLVASIKGKNGGYYIPKDIKEITALDIIVSLEGDSNINSLAYSKDKELEAVLEERIWHPLSNIVKELLSSITLEALLMNYSDRQSNMFYI